MENWLVAVDLEEGTPGAEATQGSTCNRENEWTTDNLGWMLYSVYAALGVMPQSVLTHDHGMER
jgi:hypothetical protein